MRAKSAERTIVVIGGALAGPTAAARAREEAKELEEFLAARKDLPAEWTAAPAELEKVLARDR